MITLCPYGRPTDDTVCSMPGLLYFVHERESIRIKREQGLPGPWTDDPVLQKYKFTNIRRRDDRVTQWVIDHIITPYNTEQDLWFTLLICRLINWPPTLLAMLDAEILPTSPLMFDAARFVDVIEHCKETNGKVYSGAYMIYPTRLEPGGVKSKALAKYIIGDVVKHHASISASLVDNEEPRIEAFVTALTACFGISSFIAGQVAADLTYTPWQLKGAADLYTYAPIGPGSSRGLNRLLGRKPTAVWSQTAFNAALQDINFEIKYSLLIPDLTLHDVQNVMCEYSKYSRTVLGVGTPKTMYKPATEF